MDYNNIISRDNPTLHNIVFSRHTDKLSTNLDQETVILDMISGVYSQLNTVGTSIWDMLSQPVTFADIEKMVLSTYKTTKEECAPEIITFLRELAENQLIKIENEPIS